ncbi:MULTISPECIES: tannase/feruloyl esterase family alpha/beta hydrolase [unclassified Phenylobacterium]|uniref:tannase/feruloyl esterase family alpha/beta hydrolase n=1 Tax=unclassified Phenylobacterium TaxID=2640670 RepID=UPI00083A2A48|nr:MULTISPECIES: tannase/feruloyl esterase family alpha/beta hydrolase [unclassified Phenylobacterium]
MWSRRLLLAGATWIVGLWSAPAVAAPLVCEALQERWVAGAQITAAHIVPASATAPAYCRVAATIAPELRFEVRLPVEWNGKFHYSGGGGWNGVIRPVNPSVLAQGYADVASNGGHDAKGQTDAEKAADGTFARDRDALRLWAWESVPTVTPAAKAIVEAAYGAPPERAYFEGCSTGGREGLLTALRRPDLFDGVIAGAPGSAGGYAQMQRAARFAAAPGALITPSKMAFVHRAVLSACDTTAADGLADGIVSNWAACRFDPRRLRCPDGAEGGEQCLSDPQLAVLLSLTSPVTVAGGRFTEPGYLLNGPPTSPGQWDRVAFGDPSVFRRYVDGFVKHFLAKDTQVDALAYDLNTHGAEFMAVRDLGDVAVDADLSAFARRGKLLLWTGAGDPMVPTSRTVNYYKAVVAKAGGRARAERFMRFYVLGGVAHCGGGGGADRVDALLPALDAWVTKGRPPAGLTAVRRDLVTGAPALSRPLCPYPTYARYLGKGDPAVAASFRCVRPND